MKTYFIPKDGKSITCLRCMYTSHNSNDVYFRYCNKCKDFHELSRCDFCMTPDVPLPGTYHAKTLLSQQVNFLSEPVMMHDTGEWCACQPCKDLIEKKEWKLLLERAANGVRDMEGLLDLPNRLQSIQELWTEVFGEEIK